MFIRFSSYFIELSFGRCQGQWTIGSATKTPRLLLGWVLVFTVLTKDIQMASWNLLYYGGRACSTHCRGGRIETMRTFAWAFYGFRHISQMETAGWGLRIAISIGNWCWRLGSDLHLTWWISVRSRGFLAIVRGSEPLIGFCSKPLAGWSEGRESSKAECFLHVTVVKFPPCGNVAWAIWQGHQKKKTLTSRPHQKRNTERERN